MSSPKIPPYLALRALAAVARQRSVTKAAAELNVTHAAISHQIKSIESWFGRPLFTRSGRGIEPDADALALGLVVDDAIAQMANACSAISRRHQGPDLTIAIIPSFASWWLVPRLPAFQERHPEIRVHLVYAVPGVSREGADIMIEAYAGPVTARADHTAVKLLSGITYPVCSKHYLAERGGHVDLATISPNELLHDETQESWKRWMQVSGAPLSNTTRGLVFQDFNLLTAALFAGHGVALCPVSLFQRELKSGDLVQISDLPANENKAYWMTNMQPGKPEGELFSNWISGIMIAGAI